MRKDLHQVIVDEPRRGSRWMSTLYKGVRRAKRLKLDEDYEVINDDFGHRVSMRARKFRLDYKSFGDHVAPLYRCLAAQVGRPWNDIFSELCRYYDRRSMVGLHVHQHLRDRINRNVYFNEEGKVCTYSRDRGELSSWRLYVDADGILRRASDVNGNFRWRTYNRERQKRYAEENRLTKRFFDKNGVEFTPTYGWGGSGDSNPEGITFKLEDVGENHKKYDGRTKAWFKYQWIQVEKVREVVARQEDPVFYKDKWIHLPVVDEKGNYVYVREVYFERVINRTSASKADIKKYGLNN